MKAPTKLTPKTRQYLIDVPTATLNRWKILIQPGDKKIMRAQGINPNYLAHAFNHGLATQATINKIDKYFQSKKAS